VARQLAGLALAATLVLIWSCSCLQHARKALKLVAAPYSPLPACRSCLPGVTDACHTCSKVDRLRNARDAKIEIVTPRKLGGVSITNINSQSRRGTVSRSPGSDSRCGGNGGGSRRAALWPARGRARARSRRVARSLPWRHPSPPDAQRTLAGLAHHVTHSVTWAATSGGSVRPRLTSVERFTTSSYTLGRTTGSSAGLPPFRMRAT